MLQNAWLLLIVGICMASIPERSQLDALNQRCYDNCSWIWDRFPFPDILPQWILNYHDSTLGRRVLDIGSGTGQLAKWMQIQEFEVLCLDPSPVMVKHCQAKGLTCLQTIFQDYQDTTICSVVLAILSFIHIPKKEWPEQLNKVAQLLPSKGLFIVALIEGQKEAIPDPSSDFPRFFAYFNYEEIISMTKKQFELLNFSTYPRPECSYILFAFSKR